MKLLNHDGLKRTAPGNPRRLRMALFFPLLLTAFYAQAQQNNDNCVPDVQILNDHRQVFGPGQVTIVRQKTVDNIERINMRIMNLKEGDILRRYGLENGDSIFEVCGVPVAEAFEAGMDQPVCCKAGYPDQLALKGVRDLSEQFSVAIPLKQDHTKENKH